MNTTRNSVAIVLAILIVISALNSCNTASSLEFEPITISGLVTDREDNPITNAIVRIVAPPPEKVTTTNELGQYVFTAEVDSTVTFQVEVQKEGYAVAIKEFLAIPERNVVVPVFKLSAIDDDELPPVDSEGSAYITLQSLSHESIQVREAGGVETASFEFLVTDSTGTPVSNQQAVEVHFEIASGPDGGESIYPESVITLNGIARATLTSGTAAGVVQLRASFTREDNTMQSKPVAISISGGLPDNNHFEVASDRRNIASVSIEPTIITALLGDKYGNTVAEGTAVYFGSNRGVVKGSASTNPDGYATSELRTNDDNPGTATVRVETVDENSVKLTREIDILFSGKAQLSVTHQPFDVNDFTSQEFEITLEDENGNPLAEGTSLTVEMNHPELELSGSTSVTLPDTRKSGLGTTKFNFSIRNLERAPLTRDITITISTEGPNGSATQQLQFEVPELPSAEPASIQLAAISETNIGVKGSGQRVESSNFEFIVTDSIGIPVSNQHSVEVHFEVASGPGGGESVYPKSVQTERGVARTTLTSGTITGVVQLRASFIYDGKTIQAKPVAISISGGLPDNNHFEVRTDRSNIASASVNPTIITALLGDKYGNTVAEGTAVYFGSNRGVIKGSASTNPDGYATSELRTNDDNPGTATVRVETIDENSVKLSREIDILFSGKPQLSVTPAALDLNDFTSQVFEITLQDENGNPLSQGTTMTVELDHPELELSGTTNMTLPDTRQSGPGSTEFTFTLWNPDRIPVSRDVAITISTDGPNGPVTRQLHFDSPEPPVAAPASIFLSEISNNDIGVQATGQQENSRMTFQVVDVNGNPLSSANSVDVTFRFGNSPDGGEFVTDVPVTTNSEGRAEATVISGTKAGVVQVIAEFEKEDGTMVRSQPVQIVIHGGLPSQDQFTITSNFRNFALQSNGENTIGIKVGDRYGNWVPDGTAIYFSTDIGIIHGSAYTVSGRASTTLLISNPVPQDGIGTITATTADDNNLPVTKTIDIIFSLSPIINVAPETFDILNAEDQLFEYSVKDINGNPMAPGTTIRVTVEGDEISVLGDVDITVGNPNPNFSNLTELTDYSFIIDDADPDTINDTPAQITIEVTGPNGTARKTITGRKSKNRF